MPSAALASRGGGGGLDSVTEAGVRGHRGWGQPIGEAERKGQPPPKPRRTETREKWYRGPGGLVLSAWCRLRGVGVGGGGTSPFLPDSRALGLGLRGPRWWWQLQQAGAGWAGVQGTRQAGGRGVARDDWASQPCLIAPGAGCMWGPSPDGPQRQCCPVIRLPACVISPSPSPLCFSRFLLSIRLSVYICPVTPHLSFPSFL